MLTTGPSLIRSVSRTHSLILREKLSKAPRLEFGYVRGRFRSKRNKCPKPIRASPKEKTEKRRGSGCAKVNQNKEALRKKRNESEVATKKPNSSRIGRVLVVFFVVNEKSNFEKQFLWRWGRGGRLVYSLESAGEGGFMVSGLMQSLGLGDRSLFAMPCEFVSEPLGVWLPRPSIETPFSDRNSSRSTYCKERGYKCVRAKWGMPDEIPSGRTRRSCPTSWDRGRRFGRRRCSIVRRRPCFSRRPPGFLPPSL